MAQKQSTSIAEVDSLLDELLTDAYGDGEQLRARETITYPFQSPLHPAQLRCSSVK